MGEESMSGSADRTEKPSVSSDANDRSRGVQRRRIRDDVFGNDLPTTTSDERDEDHSRHSREWYESQRPPHYE